MTIKATSDIIIYLCKNCIPQAVRLPAQWTESGLHVSVKEIPCSGKIDAQYLMHALEGGVNGVCVVTCEKGKCTLAQGNYRATVRVGTVKRLLEEIGSDPNRAELIHCPANASEAEFKTLIGDAVRRFSEVGATAS
jgi:coenzyme F420-reducing hydrogenase delta subunit